MPVLPYMFHPHLEADCLTVIVLKVVPLKFHPCIGRRDLRWAAMRYLRPAHSNWLKDKEILKASHVGYMWLYQMAL